jgi:cyclophilin family peptidyl-prolyl cis-trans isomerase
MLDMSIHLKAVGLLALLSMLLGGGARAENPHGLPDGLYSEVTTERGVVVAELFFRKVPMTVANHVGLAEGTLGPKPRKPFYDGASWFRVIEGFVLQGGDPSGTGTGDAGYLFPDEIAPGLRHAGAGTMQMANDGPDTNGSQFCFMLSAQARLNYQHSVFGQVVRGLDVLPKIQQGDTMRVKILRLGAEAQAFKADEESFNALVAKAGRYAGPRNPGPDAHFDDPDKLLPAEWDRAKNFTYKLANFERFTGVKLAARLLATPPVAAEELPAWLAREAARLGVAQRGALAVYFASTDEWRIRIGSASEAGFLRSAPAGEAPAGLETSIQSLIAAAKAEATTAINESTTRLLPGESMTDPRRIKIKADALLDPLIFRLETHDK